MKLPSTSKNKGFTIVEVLMATAILIILAGLGLFLGFDFYQSYAFSSERSSLISILEKARGLSMTNVNEAKHGVYFLPDSYVIFQGDSYVSRNSIYDEIISASSLVSRSGAEEIIFESLTGSPVATGSIVLYDGVRSFTIQIADEGRISW